MGFEANGTSIQLELEMKTIMQQEHVQLNVQNTAYKYLTSPFKPII